MVLGAEIAKRFRLERQLGAGGMGSVWAAKHLVTHKGVALKFLHAKKDDEDARRRMLREARAACAVQHPNVVAVHDVLEGEDGTPILVMDLLHGESLGEKLARERTISPADAVTIIRPVLSALSAAHDAGIVHRDLKPDNVFLVDGVCSNVKILDFGVAKLSGKDAATKETNRLTETGAMIGTPHYMAPEQAFGEADIDARADLWAVGAVLYECLAGVPPTDGQNLGQILKVLASGKIQPLAARAPAVPPGVAAIVHSLLALEKDARPPSARVVLESLDALARDQVLGAEPLAQPPGPLEERVNPETMDPIAQALPVGMTTVPSRRRRAGVWIALGALGLASAVGAYGTELRAPTVHASVPAVTAAVPPGDPIVLAAAAPSDGPAPPSSSMSAAPAPSTSVVAAPGTSSAAKARLPKSARTPPPPASGGSAARSSSGPLIVEPTF